MSMRVHFVCRGNAFRSRLAESYANYLAAGNDSLSFSSSGVEAEKYRKVNGPICWYAMYWLAKEQLIPYMSFQLTQTTPVVLAAADYIVFMRSSHFDFCRREFGFNQTAYEVWDIPDSDTAADHPGMNQDLQALQETGGIFSLIKHRTQQLVDRMKRELD